MPTALSLTEGWKFGWEEFAGEDATAKMGAAHATLDAVVPGDAHLDLMRAGLLPDLYTGMNADHALWMEQKDFWYRCEFHSAPLSGEQKAMLVFHGLDTYATIWLNRQCIGKTSNMFLRHEFDVTRILLPVGKNELVVRFAAPAFSIPFNPLHRPMSEAWSQQRLFCRKAQMSFGWDIAPRLLTVGLWRPVELVVVDAARITDSWVSPLEFRGEDVLVCVKTEVEWTGATGGVANVTGQIHDTPWSVTAKLELGRNVVTQEVLLKKPPLWNPIGYGKPTQVQTSVALRVNGRQLDARSGQTGLRRIELVTEPQPSGAQSFRFRCNGSDILVTGLNWTPLDAIFARVTPKRITQTLEELAGIGCNMLRVWGGGIYEPAHFYAECSRLGIMVWQDFMMACGWYPQTDAYATLLAEEAQQVIKDLRGYPCLAVWAGDNEVDAQYPTIANQNRLTRETLADCCRQLDPCNTYVPSSPWRPSGKPVAWVNATEGDSHYYRHGTDYRAPMNWDIRPRFLSEFGHLSLPSLELIRKYFPSGSDWPLTGAMWRYHGADTIHLKRFRGPEYVLASLKSCGRPEPKTIEEAVVASQELQAEAVCAWIEHYCADPDFGGFMLWNVADCWPQHSDSVIDYLGNRKTIFARLGPVFERVRNQRRAPDARR